MDIGEPHHFSDQWIIRIRHAATPAIALEPADQDLHKSESDQPDERRDDDGDRKRVAGQEVKTDIDRGSQKKRAEP